MDPLTDPYAGAPYNPDLANDRTRFVAELDGNPELQQQFSDLIHNEVGGQGPDAQQAFAETVFNRASARGKSLADTISDSSYYPAPSLRRGTGANYYLNLAAAMRGSDVSRGATGNASGTVGFAGGPQTFAAGGERFGVEGPDLGPRRDPLSDPYAGAPLTSKTGNGRVLMAGETPAPAEQPQDESVSLPPTPVDIRSPSLSEESTPQKSTLDQITDFLKKPSPPSIQKIEQSAPVRAATDVLRGFIPTSVKAAAEFATPAASVPDEFSNLYHAATDLIDGRPLQDVVEQYYPESQGIKRAEGTPPGSYERWKAGLDDVVGLLMARQIGHGLQAPPEILGREPLKPTLTPEQQDALTAQDAGITASLVKGTPGYARVAPETPAPGLVEGPLPAIPEPLPPPAAPPTTPPEGSLTQSVLSPEDLMTPEELQTRRTAAEQGIQQQRTQTRIADMAQQIYDQAKAQDEGGAGSPDVRVEEAIAKQRQAAQTVSQDPEVLAAFEQAHKMASEAVDTSQFAPSEFAKGLQAEGARLGLEADMARRQGLRVPQTVEQRIAQINEQLKTGLPQERPSRYAPPAPAAAPEAAPPPPEAQPAPLEIPAQVQPQKAPTGQAPPAVAGERVLNSPSTMLKNKIDDLIPFNIQWNKTTLLRKAIGGIVNKAAATSRRIIDAFGGSGTYTHYVRAMGLGKKGDILNEYDPLRHIAHKQIRDNPAAVADAVEHHVGELRKLISVKPGEPWSQLAESDRKTVSAYFRREFAKHIKSGQDIAGLTKSRGTVEMTDSPDLAGLYTLAQNQAFSFLPIQAELSPHSFGTLKQPGYGVVGKTGEFVQLLKNFQRKTMNAREIINAAGERTQGLDVRRGDGWKLIREQAGDGDFVPVDTSYLGEETANYNKATREDARPDVYLRKVSENLLPAWDRGAKLLITNNYDPVVAKQLRDLGFQVDTAERSGAVSKTSKELIATNFDHNTGEVFSRREAVLRQSAEAANRPVERGGGAAVGPGRTERLAPRPEVKNEPLSGRAGGVTDAGKKPEATSVPEREVRPRVGEEAPLRQSGETAGVRESGVEGAVQQTVAQAPPETVKNELAGNVYGKGAAGSPVEPAGREHPQPRPADAGAGVEGQKSQAMPGGGPPDQPGAVQPVPGAEAPRIAPHHEALKGLYGEEAIKRGHVLEPEVLAQNGREDVAQGRIDPYQVASKVKAGEAVTPRELGAISAEHENLARQAIAAEKAAQEAPTPENRAAYEKARQTAEDFAVHVVKPAGTMWGELGRALQETSAIDYATETGLRNAAMMRLDRELTASEASKIKKEAARVQKVAKKADNATAELSAKIEKKTKGTETPTEDEMRATLQKVLKDLTPCS